MLTAERERTAWNWLDRAQRGAFGYEAAVPSPRRRAPSLTLRSEDAELLPGQRTALVSTTRDLPRNFAIAAWAIRKHLDYVAEFVFEPRNENEKLNKRIKELKAWWNKKEQSDAVERHPFWRQIRLAEARATVDGDVGAIKLATGQLQWIEGDRIRNPWGLGMFYSDDYGDGPTLKGWPEGSRLINGVVVNRRGKAIGYAVAKRGPFGTQFLPERIVPARNFLLHAYFDRFDQLRGVSPMASALNDFKDIAESKEFALAKMKIAQLFGIKFKRQDSEELGNATAVEGERGEEDIAEAEDEGSTTPPYRKEEDGYSVDFGKGNWVLDMDPGDDAEIMESHTPSTEFQQFLASMVQLALKSLDIPHCFYDESESSWSSSRSAWIQYEESAKSKRRNIKDLLDAIELWKMSQWIASGLLELPGKMTLRDLRWDYLFVGAPWIDLQKEMAANQTALALRLTSRTRILREQQIEFEDVANELEAEEKILADRHLASVVTQPGQKPADEPPRPDE
jgi:capsid protein